MKKSFVSILALLAFYHSFAQPVETGDFKDSDLVELIKLDPNFVLDIRYYQ